MITFSFSPSNSSTFPLIAASVNTFVVSWNDAADKKLSVARDAFVIPSNTLLPFAGLFPSSSAFMLAASNSYISTSEFILEENDIGSGEENWISVILSEPQSGKIKVGTYNLISEKKVSKDDFTINELKIIDENYQEISIDEEKDKDKDVNKVDNKNYLGIKVGICAIIILIILCFVYRKYRRDIRRKEEI